MAGQVTISLDFEAGWGVIGNGRWRQREAAGVYDDLRPALRRFVAMLETTGISCTWALVGAMIDGPDRWQLSHLKGDYASKAKAFLREAKPATKDGRDLLDIVLSCRVGQSFGTHGYSHVLFTDPEQDGDVFAAELSQARASNARYGLAADFLVFPENRFGHLDRVVDAGIAMVRMPAINDRSPWARRGPIGRALAAVLRAPSPVVEVLDTTGLRLHHGTELLNWGVGAGPAKVWLTQRRIEAALALARKGGHVHFWLHPFNLAETAGLLEYVESVLRRLATWRDAGEIAVIGVGDPGSSGRLAPSSEGRE